MVFGELSPELVVDRAVPLEAVTQPDEGAILVGPAVVLRPAADQRRDLRFGQAGFLRIDGDMDTPFVFGPARRRHAVDDDLAFPDRQVAAIEQARVEELEEESPIAGHRREEDQRRRAAHDAVDRLLHVGLQRQRGWHDPGAMDFIACHAFAPYDACYKM